MVHLALIFKKNFLLIHLLTSFVNLHATATNLAAHSESQCGIQLSKRNIKIGFNVTIGYLEYVLSFLIYA